MHECKYILEVFETRCGKKSFVIDSLSIANLKKLELSNQCITLYVFKNCLQSGCHFIRDKSIRVWFHRIQNDNKLLNHYKEKIYVTPTYQIIK